MKILFGTLENGFPLEHVTDFDIRPDIILDENTRKYYKFYHAVGDDYYY